MKRSPEQRSKSRRRARAARPRPRERREGRAIDLQTAERRTRSAERSRRPTEEKAKARKTVSRLFWRSGSSQSKACTRDSPLTHELRAGEPHALETLRQGLNSREWDGHRDGPGHHEQKTRRLLLTSCSCCAGFPCPCQTAPWSPPRRSAAAGRPPPRERASCQYRLGRQHRGASGTEARRGRGQCAAHIGSRLVPMARTAPRGSTQPGASTEPYARSPESREHRGWLRSVAVFLGLTRDQMRRGLPRASGALG